MQAAAAVPFRARVEQLLHLDPAVKPGDYSQIAELAEIGSLNYVRLLKKIWPASQATLTGYELGFDDTGVVVRVGYRADVPLDASAQDVLSRALRAELGVPNLKLVLDNETPQPPPKPQRGRRK